MNTTYMQKKEDVTRAWHVIDAKGRILGDVATEIATKLIGKHKPTYTPHIDGGDFVVVLNAGKVAVTGNKQSHKMYFRHSGFPGGLKKISFEKMQALFPGRALKKAVYNMLPKNKLRSPRMVRLKLYEGTEHPHQGQIKE